MRATVSLETGDIETVRREFPEKPLYPVLVSWKPYRYGESDPKLRPAIMDVVA